MRDNQSTYIVGSKVVLVPYGRHHVPKYHEWMSDPEIRKLTASESLTLEEELKMQQRWAEDKDKCTFIVLDKTTALDKNGKIVDESTSMAGDVNIFLMEDSKNTAEIEIMIAEHKFRRDGFGKESVALMFLYANSSLNISKFVAKIGFDNGPSLKLFQHVFGFQLVSESEVFREKTLSLEFDEALNKMLMNMVGTFKVRDFV